MTISSSYKVRGSMWNMLTLFRQWRDVDIYCWCSKRFLLKSPHIVCIPKRGRSTHTHTICVCLIFYTKNTNLRRHIRLRCQRLNSTRTVVFFGAVGIVARSCWLMLRIAVRSLLFVSPPNICIATEYLFRRRIFVSPTDSSSRSGCVIVSWTFVNCTFDTGEILVTNNYKIHNNLIIIK